MGIETKKCKVCGNNTTSWIKDIITNDFICKECFKKSLSPNYNPVKEFYKSVGALKKEKKDE